MTVTAPVCPRCSREMLPCWSTSAGRHDHAVCAACGTTMPLSDPRMPGDAPEAQDATAQTCEPEPLNAEGAWCGTEKALVQAITEALRARGCRVMRCGQYIARGSGSDAGLPDLWVRPPVLRNCPDCHETTPRGWWIGLECKTARGTLSPAQRELADAGAIIVVRSVADALRAVGASE